MIKDDAEMNSGRTIGSAIIVSFIAAAGALTAWMLFHTLITLAIVQMFLPLTWQTLKISVEGNIYIKSSMTSSIDNRIFEYKDGVLHEVDQIHSKELPSITLNTDPNMQIAPSLESVYQVKSSDKLNQRWYSIAIGASNLYLEGFDIHTRQRIAFIDKTGFTLHQPYGESRIPTATKNGQLSIVVRRWSEDPPSLDLRLRMFTRTSSAYSGDWIVVLTPELPKSIDPFEGSVKTIPLPEAPLSANSWQRFSIQEDGKSTCLEASGIVFRSEDTIYFTDENDTLIESFPIPLDLRTRPFDLYLPTSSSTYILTSLDPTTSTTEILRLDSKGTVIGRESVDLTSGMRSRRSLVAWENALGWPVILLALWLDLCLFPSTHVDQGFAANFHSEQIDMLHAAWPPLLLITLLSLVLAIWTYRRHLKYNRKSAFVWSVFVFLLGPAGLVGYLAHRAWPAREKCRSCGEIVRVDRMTCSKCGEEFPLPATDGSEILVPA